MKGIDTPIGLQGDYELHWRNYSTLSGSRGQFRTLVVEVRR
jgi:hypothetical protein